MTSANAMQLGNFLRRKRDHTAPEEVGMQRPQRSRATGLRREDVAERAEISTAWYIKLERGTAGKPSRDVLLRVTEALNCSDAETQYVLDLAGFGAVTASPPPEFFLSAASQRLLRSLNPIPALFIDDNYDILQTNEAYDRMIGLKVSALPLAERNFAVLVLTSPEFRRFNRLDTEELVKQYAMTFASYLRKLLGVRAEQGVWKERLAYLFRVSPHFRAAWETGEVTVPDTDDTQYHHAELGVITLQKQMWWSRTGETGGRLQVFVPDNDEDEQQLAKLLE